jgi:glycosyltransferase involved in cell wall biosynthesis
MTLDSKFDIQAANLSMATQPTRSMRIAIVTETYVPEINGVAHTMRHIVEALLRQGHSIELNRPRQSSDESVSAIGDEASADAPMQQPNFDLRLVRGLPMPRYSELRLGFARPRTLAAQWRKLRPDVVHIVTEGPLGWAALIAARRLGIPVSSGFHTNFHAYSKHYGVGIFAGTVDFTLRALHNRCAVTMVPTAQIRQLLHARAYQRLAVVGRGLDTALFAPSRRSQALRDAWAATGDIPVVMYVGRLAAEKNLALFVQAAHAAQSVNPLTRVVLVGDGPDAATLRQANPDFIFVGMRTGGDLAAHYASADLFLFPSVTETFGNVTIEALASGLAVVAYDYAAARRHIAHEKSGLLVSFGDSKAFIAAAKKLAETLLETPTRIEKMRQHARLAANSLSWSRIADDFAAVLWDTVNGKCSPSEIDSTDFIQQASSLPT